MTEIPLGSQSGYDASIFRPYAPDVKIFMEDKKLPNSAVICVGKIRHTGKSSYAKEVEYMKSLVPEKDWKNIKITMISPSWYHYRYGAGKAYPKEVYASDEEYFADVAKAYQTELKLLYDGKRSVEIMTDRITDSVCSWNKERPGRRPKPRLLLLGSDAQRLGGRSLERQDSR